jgi:hypothetical protein
VVCIDKMFFNSSGEIIPVKITTDGVSGRSLMK